MCTGQRVHADSSVFLYGKEIEGLLLTDPVSYENEPILLSNPHEGSPRSLK